MQPSATLLTVYIFARITTIRSVFTVLKRITVASLLLKRFSPLSPLFYILRLVDLVKLKFICYPLIVLLAELDYD